jgi:hypothetical protein
MSQKPKKHKYPNPVVNFDKTSWSVKNESSFNSISRICKILFTEIKDCEPDTRQDFHTNSLQLTSSSSPPSSIFIYYHPLDPSKHPLIRVFAGTITNETLSIFNEIKNIIGPEFTTSLSKKKNSLSIDLADKTSFTPINIRTTADAANFRVHTVFEKKSISNQTEKLVNRIKDKLLQSGFEERKRKYKISGRYQQVSVYKNDFFIININHKPTLLAMPYASVKITQFVKTKQSYQYLLFFLCILKQYADHIIREHGQAIFEVLPSYIELAFDFPTNKHFIFKLLTSISCPKKRDNCGWTNEEDAPLKPYLGCSKRILEKPSHYIGGRQQRDYQLCFYNREDFTRFEPRIKRPILNKLKVNSVLSLFTKNWSLPFLNKLQIVLPNKNAFDKIDEQFHHLSKISLKSFISKAPKGNNFNRCLDDNNELRKCIETAASNFHTSIKNIFLETEIAIIIPKQSIIAEDCKSYSKNIITNKDARIIDLVNLFKNLPPGATSKRHKDANFTWFEVLDREGNRMAYILIGQISNKYPNLKNRYYVENISEYFL